MVPSTIHNDNQALGIGSALLQSFVPKCSRVQHSLHPPQILSNRWIIIQPRVKPSRHATEPVNCGPWTWLSGRVMRKAMKDLGWNWSS